jgi:hypothetical protein
VWVVQWSDSYSHPVIVALHCACRFTTESFLHARTLPQVGQMARPGFVMNITATLLCTLWVWAMAGPALGVEFGEVPDWAVRQDNGA